MNNLAASIGEQRRSYLYEPDAISQYQYLHVFRQKPHTIAEEKLMFAVLTDAIECFQRCAGATDAKSRNLYNDAAGWISSLDMASPFSFENICETLRLNPGYLRLGLMQWRNKRVHKKPGSKRLREPLRYQYRVRHRRVGLYQRAKRS
ncbi:MAG: hypothetical protein HYU46_21335 [Deltaproteobacteria bacterium]|nr:hypothetical protein [Deltaproteobacteria bacterium]